MPTADSFVAAYSKWIVEVTEGTAVAPTTAMGFVTGGQATHDESTVRRAAMGSQVQIKPGPVKPSLSIDVEVQTSVVAALFTASPTLSYTIDVGTSRANTGFKFRGAKPQKLTISSKLDAAGKYTYDFADAWDVDISGNSAEVELAGAILEWYETVVSIGAAAYYCQSWECTVDNAYKPFWALDSAAAAKRVRLGHVRGLQTVELSAEILSPHALSDIGDDVIAAVASVNTMTSVNAGATIVHTLSSMTRKSAGFSISADDLWIEKIDYMGIPGSLVLS